MSYSTYLLQLPSSYYFRFHVPVELQKIVGRKELRYSLRTGSKAEAKPIARLLAGKIQSFFKKLKGNVMSSQELSQNQIQGIIKDYINKTLNSDNEYRITMEPLPHETLDEDSMNIEALLEHFKRELGRSNHVEAVGKQVNRLLKEKSITCNTESDSFRLLCWEFLKAEINITESILARNEGNISKELQPLSATPDALPDKTSEPFGKIVKAYCDENIRGEMWKPRTITARERAFKFAVNFFGEETQIHTIDGKRMQDFKNTLDKLPKNFSNAKKYEGMSYQELAALNLSKEECVTRKTINDNYIGPVQSVFSWAKINSYIDNDPTEGIRFKVKKTKTARDERNRFTSEDLQKLFNSKEYREDKHKKPYMFWLPLLALYTGCRANELCSLYCEDVKEVDNVWVLDINQDYKDKSVKTSEIRLIPIHPTLLDLGFLEFVQQKKKVGHKRIFHELKYIGDNYAHYATRWFGKYKVKCGIVAESGDKGLHSFRHTLADNLGQQLIDLTVIKAITGHTEKGETLGRYRKSLKPEVVLEKGIKMLNYEGLDLSHLKKSKHVRVIK